MNILRFLICNSRMSGKQLLLGRHYTTWDDFHQCCTHICQDKAEYDKLCREVVGKQQKRFWGDVEVFNTATKQRSKVTDIESLTLTGATWQERLQLEYHLLRERTGKLNDFILTNASFNQMEPALRDLLQNQLAAMLAYLRTLKERMDLCQVPPMVPEVHANVAAHEAEALPAAEPLSQTPGDSQSGGEQSPAESMGTLSEPEQAPVIDLAADLAANIPSADDVGAGQEQPEAVSEELPPEDAPPASTPPAKRKAGRPAKEAAAPAKKRK